MNVPYMTLEVAEALRARGLLRQEDIPPVAMSLLEQGRDTETIRRLAGLTDDDLSQAADLFERMLAELGRRQPSPGESADALARHLARAVLTTASNLRSLAADGARLAVAFDYAEVVMPFYEADDAYDFQGLFPRADIDRDLLEYATRLLDSPPKHAV